MIGELLAYGFRVAIVLFLLTVNAFIPWPDITPALALFPTAFNTLYFFNYFMPMYTVFWVFGIVFTIESIFFGWRFLTMIAVYIGSGQFVWGSRQEKHQIGEGSIGGGGYGKGAPGL